jgi:hypothetical protein
MRTGGAGGATFFVSVGSEVLVIAISRRYSAESVFPSPLAGIQQKTALDPKLNPCQMDPKTCECS